MVELALEANPISLGAVRKAPAGKPFTILLTVPVETEAQLEQLVYSVRCGSGEGETRTEAKPETSVSGPEVKEEGHVFTIEGIVPPYREIFGVTGLFDGWFLPERARRSGSA